MSSISPEMDESLLAELAELDDTQWQALQVENPELAEQIRLTRQVRLLVATLRADVPELPADFEARLLARVQGNATLITLLNAGLGGFSQVLLEFLNLLLGLLPQTPPRTATA